MRTSATCRAPEGARGFSLLELLVVLAIMGLAAALAAPSVMRSVDAWRSQADVDAMIDQMRGLPAQARAAGRTLVVDAETLAGTDGPLRPPEGWTLSTGTAWKVRANGYCEGGDVLMRSEARERRLRATAPFCDAERVEE